MTKRPHTTNYIAVQKAIQNYRISLRDGSVRNERNQSVGSNTYEPRLSVRITTKEGRKKYNVRISKIVGFVKYGAMAFRKNAQIRHRDGDKSNNSGTNLMLVQMPIVRGNLSTAQIRRIRNLANRGRLTQTQIAERTGASRTQVSRIASGQIHSMIR